MGLIFGEVWSSLLVTSGALFFEGFGLSFLKVLGSEISKFLAQVLAPFSAGWIYYCCILGCPGKSLFLDPILDYFSTPDFFFLR